MGAAAHWVRPLEGDASSCPDRRIGPAKSRGLKSFEFDEIKARNRKVSAFQSHTGHDKACPSSESEVPNTWHGDA